MNVIFVKDYQEMSKVAANIIAKQINQKPNSVLGLATGSSPIGTYQELIAMNKASMVSFNQVSTYNLDEYCGISKDHPQSYFRFMHENLFNHVDINLDQVHIPSAISHNLQQECDDYNKALNHVTIDLQLLGIGSNGHIGFNEPGTSFDQETFVVELTEKTRKDNQRFFNSFNEVPTHAVTMGIKNIFNSAKILMLISGEAKAKAVYGLLKGPITVDFPASILQLHPNVTVIIDENAAKLIK
jgi:glucosamine-6-phosphate deaminase